MPAPPPVAERCWCRREIFCSARFTLASSINLHLDKGATILISDDMTNYPVVNAKRYQDCITVADAHDIEISGEGDD